MGVNEPSTAGAGRGGVMYYAEALFEGEPGPVCLMGRVVIGDDPEQVRRFFDKWWRTHSFWIKETDLDRSDRGLSGAVTVDEAVVELAELGLPAPLN